MIKKIVKKAHKLSMNCSRCLKEHNKLWWFNSDCSMWDNSMYCKECYSHIYNNLQELKDFSKIHYGPSSVVKSIDCFKKGN